MHFVIYNKYYNINNMNVLNGKRNLFLYNNANINTEVNFYKTSKYSSEKQLLKYYNNHL